MCPGCPGVTVGHQGQQLGRRDLERTSGTLVSASNRQLPSGCCHNCSFTLPLNSYTALLLISSNPELFKGILGNIVSSVNNAKTHIKYKITLNEYLYYYYQKLPNTNLLSVFRRITEKKNPENWLQKYLGTLFALCIYLIIFVLFLVQNHKVIRITLNLKILPPKLVNSIISINSYK